MDDLKITESPMYMHQNDKPVIGFWGLGFENRDMTVAQAERVLDSYQTPEESKYQVYVMGGVHHTWRTSTKAGWEVVFERLDMISPWRPLFYNGGPSNQDNINVLIGDINWCDERGIDYNPVVTPGGSTAYQNGPESRNNFPRMGGQFLWDQAYEVIRTGNKFMYVAMFDEIDEGTAMYKLAEIPDDCPVADPALVPLNEDGFDLPSDWYLQLGAEMQKMLDGTIELTSQILISAQEATCDDGIQNGDETGIY